MNTRNRSRRLGVFLVVTALITLAGLSTVAILRGQYEQRLRHRIFSPKPIQSPRPTAVSTNNNPVLMLLGDSRIAEWKLPVFSGWRIINAGAGGLTSGETLLHVPVLLEELHPDVVALQVGINDLKFLGLKPRDSALLVSLVESNVAAIVGECVRHGSKVMLLKIWPPGKPSAVRRMLWDQQIEISVKELNARLDSLEIPERIHVIDLFTSAGFLPTDDQYRDALHFKPEVYQQLTPALEREANALLSSRN